MGKISVILLFFLISCATPYDFEDYELDSLSDTRVDFLYGTLTKEDGVWVPATVKNRRQWAWDQLSGYDQKIFEYVTQREDLEKFLSQENNKKTDQRDFAYERYVTNQIEVISWRQERVEQQKTHFWNQYRYLVGEQKQIVPMRKINNKRYY